MRETDVRGRARWAAREGVVIALIVLFWVALGVAFSVFLGGLLVGVRAVGDIAPVLFRPAFEFLSRFDRVGPTVVLPAAMANVGLYVLVRAGQALIDYHENGA